MVGQIREALARMGFQSQMVSVDHLEDLRKELEQHYEDGRISGEIYSMLQRCFDFRVPEELAGAESIIIVAAESPRIVFHAGWQKKKVPVHVPPTYAEHATMAEKVQEILKRELESARHTVVRARLPEKALAVHSGLARYGRNNITYVPGLGSFHCLAAFYSDAPCESDSWCDLRMLETCEGCDACMAACPTGAIHDDWIVVRAERCICNLNERGGEFPSWVDRSWHDSAVGCFHCQEVCPENAAVLDKITKGPEFSEEETASILQAKSSEDVSSEVCDKLKEMGLHVYMHAIARNLRTLFEQAGLSV